MGMTVSWVRVSNSTLVACFLRRDACLMEGTSLVWVSVELYNKRDTLANHSCFLFSVLSAKREPVLKPFLSRFSSIYCEPLWKVLLFFRTARHHVQEEFEPRPSWPVVKICNVHWYCSEADFCSLFRCALLICVHREPFFSSFSVLYCIFTNLTPVCF